MERLAEIERQAILQCLRQHDFHADLRRGPDQYQQRQTENERRKFHLNIARVWQRKSQPRKICVARSELSNNCAAVPPFSPETTDFSRWHVLCACSTCH